MDNWDEIEVVREGICAAIVTAKMPPELTPEMCTLLRGAIPAMLTAVGAKPSVHERKCVSRGDAACEIVVNW